MIKVNDILIDYKPGMTVADALKEAGAKIDHMALIMVQKKIVAIDEIDKVYLEDEEEIKVLTIVSGG